MTNRSEDTRCMCSHAKQVHSDITEAHECTHRYCSCLSYTRVGEAGFDPAEAQNRPYTMQNCSFDSLLDTANRQWNQIQVWTRRHVGWQAEQRELKQQIRDADKTKQAMEVEMLALRSQIDRHQEMFKLLADAGRLPSFMMDVLAPDDEDHEVATYTDC